MLIYWRVMLITPRCKLKFIVLSLGMSWKVLENFEKGRFMPCSMEMFMAFINKKNDKWW